MSCTLFVTSEAGSPKHHRGAPHSQELISLDFWVVLLLHGLIARERFGLFFVFQIKERILLGIYIQFTNIVICFRFPNFVIWGCVRVCCMAVYHLCRAQPSIHYHSSVLDQLLLQRHQAFIRITTNYSTCILKPHAGYIQRNRGTSYPRAPSWHSAHM